MKLTTEPLRQPGSRTALRSNAVVSTTAPFANAPWIAVGADLGALRGCSFSQGGSSPASSRPLPAMTTSSADRSRNCSFCSMVVSVFRGPLLRGKGAFGHAQKRAELGCIKPRGMTLLFVSEARIRFTVQKTTPAACNMAGDDVPAPGRVIQNPGLDQCG